MPFEHAGKKYTNADSYRTAKATSKGGDSPKPAEHVEPDGDEAVPEVGHVHMALKGLHQATGKAHTVIVHNDDGTTEEHHVDADGNIVEEGEPEMAAAAPVAHHGGPPHGSPSTKGMLG